MTRCSYYVLAESFPDAIVSDNTTIYVVIIIAVMIILLLVAVAARYQDMI